LKPKKTCSNFLTALKVIFIHVSIKGSGNACSIYR